MLFCIRCKTLIGYLQNVVRILAKREISLRHQNVTKKGVIFPCCRLAKRGGKKEKKEEEEEKKERKGREGERERGGRDWVCLKINQYFLFTWW